MLKERLSGTNNYSRQNRTTGEVGANVETPSIEQQPCSVELSSIIDKFVSGDDLFTAGSIDEANDLVGLEQSSCQDRQ